MAKYAMKSIYKKPPGGNKLEGWGARVVGSKREGTVLRKWTMLR